MGETVPLDSLLLVSRQGREKERRNWATLRIGNLVPCVYKYIPEDGQQLPGDLSSPNGKGSTKQEARIEESQDRVTL